MYFMFNQGIQRTKLHKIGWNSSDTAQLFFDNVRVPVTNIIGDEGAGFFYQMLQVKRKNCNKEYKLLYVYHLMRA